MEPFFRGLRRALEDSGVPVEVAQVEYGHGQWEINLDYAGALEMADRHMLFKQAVRDYAAQHGYTATFMPRPVTGPAQALTARPARREHPRRRDAGDNAYP